MTEEKQATVSTGTLGDILKTATEEVKAEVEAEVNEPIKELIKEPIKEEVKAEVKEPVAEVKEEAEPDTAKFKVPKKETEQKEQKPEVKQEAPDLKTLLKSADRAEVLKMLGLDDFDIQFADYRKSGGDPYKYVEAKGRDYTKVPDLTLIKEKIRAENGFLNPEEVETLTEVELAKYGLHEDATEQEKRIGQVLLKRDAQKIREQRIAEDAKFQIPAVEQRVENKPDPQADYTKAVFENPTTKNLLQSKRVVADGGEEGHKFSFDVDDPQELVDLWTKPDISAKYMLNEKGEPDLEKQYLMGLMAIDPKFVINSLINHGKTIGEKQRLAKGQNIDKKQQVTPPTNQQSEGEAWANAKTGKLSDFI